MITNSDLKTVEIVHRAFSTNSGTRIHYRQAGEGSEAVVCFHGFPQSGRSWEKLAAQLAQRFTVIAPDLRGAGESQRPPTGYDKKTVAADIHELVVSLGLSRVHLVGHDIGAAVAYAYAAQWPSEISDLTMIEMLLPGFGLEELWAIRKPGEFAHMPFFMTQDLPEWLIEGREEAFFDWFIRNMVADQSAFDPDDIAAYAQAYARPGALRAGFDGYRAFWQDAEDNKLFARSKLKMPVLAIGAGLSVGTALEQSLRPLTEDLRGLVFEDCGHFIPDEQPERLARELDAFFGGRIKRL
ncbi:MAG: alpha/beta fold hydrolase [Chroococcidiopsis sp.]